MVKRILVPLDGSALAEEALPHARALTEPGDTLILLRVLPREEPIYAYYGQLLLSVEDASELEERSARADLERAAATVQGSGLGIRSEIVEGDPAEQILRVAGEQDLGLIAMTTHGRGAVGRLVFGSVADRVARGASVPVLLVRPRDEATGPPHPDIRRVVVPLDQPSSLKG